MALPRTPIPLSPESQLGVVQYLKSAKSLYSTSYNIRSQLEQRDRYYYREDDRSSAQWKARNANAAGDKSKIQNITVPVVMPQVESALANLAGVFLTGYPIFGTYAPPGNEQALRQFDATIADNCTKLGWVPELVKVMRDGLKYDLGISEVTWVKKKIFQITNPTLERLEQGAAVEDEYQGNAIKRIDPYNAILDTRVDPDKNHLEGEYAGYTELLSRINIKKRMEDLDPEFSMNFKLALESGNATISSSASDAGYYIPTINPDALLPVANRYDHDWLQWANLVPNAGQRNIAYHSAYQWTILYARILPSDFGMRVSNAGKVQIWKFIIINDQVCIYAERQTNAHSMLPIVVCKPSNDGMGWQSKSFGENAQPIQDISSSLMNSALASQRRKVYDRILYDPTRVRKQDIDNTDPVARIPVKGAQLGKGLESAVASMQYNDQGVAEILQMSQQIVGMGEILNGQNRVQQGQFQKGNKTRREFETVMGAANNRQQLSSISLEGTFWTPIKEMIKTNMLQYQPANQKVVTRDTKEQITVDPAALRKAAIEFTLSDGMLSSEKLGSLDVAQTMLQAAAVVPEVQMKYDVMGILAQTWALQGLHWINDYKRDDAEQAEYIAKTTQQTLAQGNAKPPAPPTPDAGARGAV